MEQSPFQYCRKFNYELYEFFQTVAALYEQQSGHSEGRTDPSKSDDCNWERQISKKIAMRWTEDKSWQCTQLLIPDTPHSIWIDAQNAVG